MSFHLRYAVLRCVKLSTLHCAALHCARLHYRLRGFKLLLLLDACVSEGNCFATFCVNCQSHSCQASLSARTPLSQERQSGSSGEGGRVSGLMQYHCITSHFITSNHITLHPNSTPTPPQSQLHPTPPHLDSHTFSSPSPPPSSPSTYRF